MLGLILYYTLFHLITTKMTQSTPGPRSAIEQEILIEEKRFADALKADVEFYVLKSIRQKINLLKSSLAAGQDHPRPDFTHSQDGYTHTL